MSLKLLYIASLSDKPDRDSQWIRAFRDVGFVTHGFSTAQRINTSQGLIGRLQRRLHFGRAVAAMRRELIETVEEIRPDWVHFRMPLEFDKATILEIKARCPLVSEYSNDDPCSPHRVRGMWRLYDETIPVFDAHFVFRARNVRDLQEKGASRVLHTPPYYVPWRHYPPVWNQGEYEHWCSDAAFIGHWENDNRLTAIDSLVGSGFRITLKGGGWNDRCRGRVSSRLIPIHPVFGEEYNKIYAAAAAGLCFLSKINRDQLTRRTLEIPAVGGLLVCERTSEVELVFKDREEAFFFSDTDELVQIVRQVSKDTYLRKQVADAGRERLLHGSHSINDRVRQILEFLKTNCLLDVNKL
jgi:spore maturation protein CgeB